MVDQNRFWSRSRECCNECQRTCVSRAVVLDAHGKAGPRLGDWRVRNLPLPFAVDARPRGDAALWHRGRRPRHRASVHRRRCHHRSVASSYMARHTPFAAGPYAGASTSEQPHPLVSRPRSSVNSESGDAPGAQGARRAHTGSRQPTSNASPRDQRRSNVTGLLGRDTCPGMHCPKGTLQMTTTVQRRLTP